MNLALASILISGSLFIQSAEAGSRVNTRERLETIRRTQYGITCRNLKYKHARLEDIYKSEGEAGLRNAINNPNKPDYWIDRSEIDTWKNCQTEWWYVHL